ncbi:MAG: sn-glycerol-3-phosphate ABC transporter ATP-binding protein UgpC [Phycisphaeraceae bacterium]|nr:sn-glycerol-3-phosphate ABC transporter ATP-binding protein UgpC [Phycisphaeraceae bacterium]
MARVHLEHVKKTYPNGFEAVHDFCFDIADQEFVALVGPSGCGKSTTLRMIAGLEEITDGEITIGDRVVNDVAPKDRDIAMVFQNYALYPHMTVYKNMAFGLKLRGAPKTEIDEKVRNAAKILGITELLDRKPGQLSGGQRQRVAVGRAIVRDPACFLFDEPLSNLDAKLRVEMRAELKRLHQRLQTTTVYVTHDQEEAMTLGDRVVVMKDGYLMQAGAPLEVYRHPANRFVASFLGTPPMNFFDGAIVLDDGRLQVEAGDQRLAVPAWAADELQGRAGSPVVLGVRPEAFSETPIEGQSDNTMKMTVKVVEPLGDRMDVYLSSPEHDHVIARVKAHEGLEPDGEITLHVDLERIHFFEPEAEDAPPHASGVNLCLEAEKART